MTNQVINALEHGNIAIVYGARQTGKTTLAKMILERWPDGAYLNCDEPDIRFQLANHSSTELKLLFGDAAVVVIDEAQRVKNIGVTAKLIHDTFPKIKLLLTGSSSFEIANKIKEPLTGRAREFLLLPLAISEISTSSLEMSRLVEKSLTQGGYPKIWNMSIKDSSIYLSDIANNYLYRDAFNSDTVFNSDIFDRLLLLLALQLGNEMSYSELGQRLGLRKETVNRYISLLEKAYIVFRLPQFRRNQRNEIGRLRKVYFYDIGIRNGIIKNFRPINAREDVGALWENFCIIERMKYLQRLGHNAKHYYWRSNTQQEIDLIEEDGLNLEGFEFKFSNTSKFKVPNSFTVQYPDVKVSKISRSNFLNFIWEQYNPTDNSIERYNGTPE